MKIGVYIDVSNLSMNGGRHMRYEVLRAFACRNGGEAVRLNAYVSFDPSKADLDSEYRQGQFRFHAALRDLGYKVITKETKWFVNDDGSRVGKSNVDLDLAVDALMQSDRLDRVVLATGDGDFVQVVKALQNKGCRVEIVAFDNVSGQLRQEADLYFSGYLIPGLVPIRRHDTVCKWGGVDGYARGIFYLWDDTRHYGFMRYLTGFEGHLWQLDTREQESPYNDIFCHGSDLPQDVDGAKLLNRKTICEFRIKEWAREDRPEESRIKAVDLRLIDART